MPRKKARKSKPPQPADTFGERAKQFGEEAGSLGKKFARNGEEFGRHAKERGRECRRWYFDTFGAVGPVLSAIFSTIFLAFGIWIMRFFARETASTLLYGLHDFFLSNIGLFFLIFLLSSSFSYLSRCCYRKYLVVSPFATAFGITVFFWVAANVVEVANMDIGNAELFMVTDIIIANLFSIFWFFLIVGYFFLLVRLLLGRASGDACCETARREPQKSMQAQEPDGVKRLYRSGKDKVLGGVCGGIAEYLGVDPVLIRLIWAIAVFFYGTGVLLYIIAWIIIPRNPNHEWRD